MMAACFEVDAPKRLASDLTEHLFLQSISTSVVKWKPAHVVQPLACQSRDKRR